MSGDLSNMSTESESTSGTSSSETSGSGDSQSGGDTPPSQFGVLELPVCEALGPLAKGWPFNLGPRNRVSGSHFSQMRVQFKISSEIQLLAGPRGSTYLIDAPSGYVEFNMAFFDAGVRLPLNPVVTDFLVRAAVSPGQLAPNVYASLLGFIILCRVYNRVEPDLRVFFRLYSFRWCESAVYCTAPLSTRVLIDLPTSNKGWRGRHFFVGGLHPDLKRMVSMTRKLGIC